MAKKFTIEDFSNRLSPNSSMQSFKVKENLFNFKIKKRKCEKCNLYKWENKDIPLELHHVDGDNKNNSILNLQILCPNCHALTENYRGRGKIGQKTINKVSESDIINAVKTSHNYREALIKCGLNGYGGTYVRIKKIVKENNLCFLKKKPKIIKSKNMKASEMPKIPYIPKTKIAWPDKIALEKMIKSQSVLSIAKSLGVSDNAVRKRARSYGIDVKHLSKWSQKYGNKSSCETQNKQ